MSNTSPTDTTHDRSRRRLYNIVGDEENSLTETRRKVVDLGVEYLDVNVGFVSKIDVDSGRFEVLVSTNDEALPAGTVFDLEETYCRKCVESDSVLAVSDAPGSGWEDDPAYQTHGLDCYLGTPIHVDGELVGTVCFADNEAREPVFSPSERAFVELAARLLGRERENARHEQILEARENRLDERDKELERSERKYESLIETAPDAIFVASEEKLEFVTVNQSAEELTGYAESELVGEPVSKVHPQGRTSGYLDAIRAAQAADDAIVELDDGEPLFIEQKDGTSVPVELSAATVELDGETYFQCIVRDISNRRERMRELQIKDQAIEDAPVGITISDATGDDDVEDNGLIYANDRFQSMTGYDWETMAGRNCRILQGARTDQGAVDELRTGIAAEEPVRTELLNYRQDGTPFWNEVSISPVETSDDAVSHFVGFQRDVTTRKRQSKLVDILNRVLRHNLRNGLNVVMSRSNELLAKVDEDLQPQVKSIRSRARELVALSERARDIDQVVRTGSEPTAHDVVPMVEDTIADLRREYPDATIDLSAPDSQSVYATEALREAVRELVRNGVEHGGEAPTVEVGVSSESEDGIVQLSVSDAGPGLPPGEQTVLERGYETPLEHSSGLGLWFVNWVVTGVGGRVEATVDDGTDVTVTLWNPNDEKRSR